MWQGWFCLGAALLANVMYFAARYCKDEEEARLWLVINSVWLVAFILIGALR